MSRVRIVPLLALASMSAGMILVLAACSGSQPQQAVGAQPATQAEPAAAPAPQANAAPSDQAAAQPAAQPQPSAPAPAAAAPAVQAPRAPAPAAPAPVAAVPPASAAAAPAAPAAAAPAPARAPAPAPKPEPRVAELKAGQPIMVRTTRVLSTKTMKTGDVFSAIIEEPIVVNGWTAVPAGSRVEGRIAEVDKGGRVKGKASLTLELTSLTPTNGRKIEIVTSPIESEAAANKGKDVAKVGIGAGAGAAVGAIAGGGKGAAIGALVGGGAGAAMRGEAAEVPAETVLGFELRSPVTITEKK